MQESMNSLIVDVCREKNISSKKISFAFLCCCLYHNALFKKNAKEKG